MTIFHLFNPSLALLIGEAESILLNQILYWIPKCGRKISGQKERWIYNSLNDWHKQFNYWSMYKLRKTIKSLEKANLIKSIKVNAKKWDHTKWYTINNKHYEKILTTLPSLNKVEDHFYTKSSSTKQTLEFIKKNQGNPLAYRFVENQQVIKTKNNYTKSISSIYKIKKKKSVSNKPSPLQFKTKHPTVSNQTTTQNICKKKEQVAKKMQRIWEKVFSCSSKPIRCYLNKAIIEKLEKIKKQKFNNNLQEWEKYVKKINSSHFLMGEKVGSNFKAVLPWLIKEETIDAIQQGAYGVGDRELDLYNLDKNIQEKEYDIRIELNRKISQHFKDKMDLQIEEKNFLNYIKKKQYEKDRDYYRVKEYINKISKYQISKISMTPENFYSASNTQLKKQILNFYLASKHLSINELLLKEQIVKIKENHHDKHQVFNKMKSLSASLEQTSLSTLNNVTSLNNTLKIVN